METKFGDAVVVPEFDIQGRLCPLGIELVASTSPDGPVNQFIQRRGEGLYYIAFKVPDIEQAVMELQSRGLRLIGRERMGNLKEAQFHPKDSFGVMIELAEYGYVMESGRIVLDGLADRLVENEDIKEFYLGLD